MAAYDLVAALPLEDGRLWGAAAVDFQREDARAVLDLAGPRLHFLTRPRGASKTSDLAAVAIAVLIDQAPAGSRSYAVAADADQAALLHDALSGFVLRAPVLAEHLDVQTRRVSARRSGARLDVLAADAPGTYGLRPYFIVADELSVWPSTQNARGVWTAIVSAVPKIADSRLVVLTTAGDPVHWSAKVLAHARSSSAWRVREMPGPCPWIASEALEEQRALLTESQFQRLHLNRWVAAEDRLVDLEGLRACVTLDGPLDAKPNVAYVVGVDVGLRKDRTAVAICHGERVEASSSRRVILDRLQVLEGSRESEVQLAHVEEAVFQAWRSYNRAKVRLDPWQAIGLAQRLRSRGVHVEEFPFSAQSVGRLASTLHLLLRDRLLDLPPDEALLDELANVRLRETSPGVVRMDHDPGRHDDRAIALALAATALIEKSRPTPATASAAHGRIVSPLRSTMRDGSSGLAVAAAYRDPSGRRVPPLPPFLDPRRRGRGRVWSPDRKRGA